MPSLNWMPELQHLHIPLRVHTKKKL
uniref:Plant UBX domain-containing protein 11 isoform X2 n=1 Tax=Rhizophora mucronata TaxID=61149 RepID=A0A2P2KII8_RHIMU